MTIKRYIANADNTITNAYEENLTTRGTGSNMGQADVVEVFSIYAQESSSSVELERFLVNFPISDITTDRADGVVPASGSVSFYLKMTNAPHAGKTPRDFQLVVSAVSQSWQEGIGLDMENYTDLTYDGDGSNWINATGDDLKEITEVSFDSDTKTQYGSKNGADSRYIVIYNSSTKYNVWFNDGSGDSAPTESGTNAEVNISAGSLDSAAEFATQFHSVVNALADFSANVVSTKVYVTASAWGPVEASSYEFGGIGGTGGVPGCSLTTIQSGSWAVKWTTEGGDYYTDASSSYTASFDTGLEDIEVDITRLVEQWINDANGVSSWNGDDLVGPKPNYGIGVYLNAAYEGSSSTNQNGATTSYYTKKFFARHSEFFFKRPYIEARWDSVKQDDRGSFYFSSSLAPAGDNLNTIYLYNYVRGTLRNIPSIGTDPIYVQLYSGSADNSAPFGSPLDLVVDASHVKSTSPTFVTGAHVSTGIYSATVAVTGTSDLTKVFDVWTSNHGAVQFYTGSIDTNVQLSRGYTTGTRYILSMPNLQKEYYKNDTARLRLFVRERNWSPNIYTKATSVIPAHLIPTASYRVLRVADNAEVISYGTGTLQYTGLSYDVSGNYFDLDMKLFEPGYQYQLQYTFKDENTSTYYEQPYMFKFRVQE